VSCRTCCQGRGVSVPCTISFPGDSRSHRWCGEKHCCEPCRPAVYHSSIIASVQSHRAAVCHAAVRHAAPRLRPPRQSPPPSATLLPAAAPDEAPSRRRAGSPSCPAQLRRRPDVQWVVPRVKVNMSLLQPF
jgi:hypothetical protein